MSQRNDRFRTAPHTGERAKFSSGKGAIVGGLVGGVTGTLFVLLKGDYHSCATDVGPGYCGLTAVAIVIGLAVVGALVGYVVGAR
jgi:hypothetical protein